MEPGLDAFSLGVGGICVALAAVLRGYTGFGFAIAGVPLLSLFFSPAAIVPLAMVLQVAAGLDGTWRDRAHVDKALLKPLLIPATVFLWGGVAMLAVLDVDTARIVVAVGVVGAVALMASGVRLTGPPRLPLVVGTGAVAGFLGGLLAMPGPPVIALLMASSLPAERIRATLIAFFTVTGVIGLALAALEGLVLFERLPFYGVMLPIMLIGARLGRRLFHTQLGAYYRPVGMVCLSAVAVAACIRAFWP